MDIQTVWFCLIGAFLAIYALLDGYDYGVGVLSLFVKKKQKSACYRAIGVMPDGNEVWLLGLGVALFTLFPPVMKGLLSAYYLPFLGVLLAFIIRSVAFEVRQRTEQPLARSISEWSFGITSFIVPFILGGVLGNLLQGGQTKCFFSPYAIVIGIVLNVIFVLHGASYIRLKADGKFEKTAQNWLIRTWFVLIGVYFVATFTTFLWVPAQFESLSGSGLFRLIFVVILISMGLVAFLSRNKNQKGAFIASCVNIGAMAGLFLLTLYPDMLPGISGGLTVYSGAAEEAHLKSGLVMAIISVPALLIYNHFMYQVFRKDIRLKAD